MKIESPLLFTQIDQLENAAIAAIPDETTLGVQHFGLKPIHALSSAPAQTVVLPLLADSGDCFCEVWHSSQASREGKIGDVRYRQTDSLLFGTLSIDESSLTVPPGESPLRAAAEHAYRQVFSLLAAQGYAYLWRVWNYIPRIHDDEAGLERYRQFNIGRHHAFEAFRRPVDSSPAACALGVAGGPLSIAFIASRTPSTRLENPRQVSAFAYPSQYGPRSPSFTRAALAGNGEGEILFISGTASIVGHETMHHGDIVAQTRETMANIAVLVEQANAQRQSADYTLQDLIYRVYIRHAADYTAVRDTLHALLGNDIQCVYMQADVCRADLLVEIEALALKPTKGSTS
jgi:enamine deaminase RidA (YjgF/YER057c/UK114 family)